MTKFVVAAAAIAAVLSAGGAVAQTPAAPPAAAPARPTIASSIEALLANPATKAVMDRHMPGLADHPAYPQFKAMTLTQVAPHSQGHITPELLTTIDAELQALPAE